MKKIKDHSFEGSICPFCKDVFKYSTEMNKNEPKHVNAGDTILCMSCGHWSLVDYMGIPQIPEKNILTLVLESGYVDLATNMHIVSVKWKEENPDKVALHNKVSSLINR